MIKTFKGPKDSEIGHTTKQMEQKQAREIKYFLEYLHAKRAPEIL